MLSRKGLLLCAAGCLMIPANGFAQIQGCDQDGFSDGAYCDNNGNCKSGSGWNLCQKLDDHYAQYADLPIGARAVYKYGKVWPVTPRPPEPNAKIVHRYYYGHYWPHPHDCRDRAVVYTYTALQESRGWANETTLYDYHFNAETQQLTDAGALQLRMIMEDTPSKYRRAFVQTSLDAGANEARIASVKNAVARLSGGVDSLPVELRNTRAYGRSANEIDQLNKAIITSAPAPRIQYGQSSGYGITTGR